MDVSGKAYSLDLGGNRFLASRQRELEQNPDPKGIFDMYIKWRAITGSGPWNGTPEDLLEYTLGRAKPLAERFSGTVNLYHMLKRLEQREGVENNQIIVDVVSQLSAAYHSIPSPMESRLWEKIKVLFDRAIQTYVDDVAEQRGTKTRRKGADLRH